MPINFHDERNKLTYTGRVADDSWKEAVLSRTGADGLRIADIGCGGGIYSRAWVGLGAHQVIGIDSSPTMISAAADSCADLSDISFRVGHADNTGLPDESVDMVFERALIHHLTDLRSCFEEAMRILKPGGVVLIQDRTPQDIALPGSHEHIRGYFFECFPRLLEVELARRRPSHVVVNELKRVGFETFEPISVWETRRVYPSAMELGEDLRQRRGRSILHELTDEEIASLVSLIATKLDNHAEVVEKDRWTIWHARKPQ